MNVAVASDHGGLTVKKLLLDHLKRRSDAVEDLGTCGTERVDYPDFAVPVVTRVLAGKADRGVLVCTTGIGMSIAANRFSGIRAALCCTAEDAAGTVELEGGDADRGHAEEDHDQVDEEQSMPEGHGRTVGRRAALGRGGHARSRPTSR